MPTDTLQILQIKKHNRDILGLGHAPPNAKQRKNENIVDAPQSFLYLPYKEILALYEFSKSQEILV